MASKEGLPVARGGAEGPLATGWALIAMAVVLLVVAGIRIRLLNLPLERDEGEYAFMGQLLLDGVAPYGEAANMKWPGTYLVYAAIMAVFGQTTVGIHLGLLLVNLASSVLLFLLGRRIAGPLAGAAASAAHSVLTIGIPTLGLAAHATHFIVLCGLGGLVLLTGPKPAGPWRLLVSGALFGFACVIKQAGAVFGAFALAWLVWQLLFVQRIGARRCGVGLVWLVAGGLVPPALTALWLWWAGVWSKFWFWTVAYAGAYVSIESFGKGMGTLGAMAKELFFAAPALWGVAAVGLAVLFRWPAARPWRGFTLGLLVTTFASTCPGLYFRNHYFLVPMPVLALLVGVATAAFTGWFRKRGRALAAIPCGIVLVSLVQALWVGRPVFFASPPAVACRRIYSQNPFPEAVVIGQYLREHTRPEARIAVIGSEPEIYFYAHRRAATPFLYTYPLVETQPLAAKMQREFAQNIEAADPDYVVFVSVSTSWLAMPGADAFVFDWFGGYSEQHLHDIGMVDIVSLDHTKYRWGGGPAQLQPLADNWLAILRNNRLRSLPPPGG